MAEIVEEIHIARPPADVWAVLAAFDAIGTWAPNVDHSCLTTAQSHGVGSVRRIQAGRNVLLERVIEWDPERSLSYSIQGLPPVIRSVTNTWQLSEHGSGTHVALISRVDAGPRPPQLLVARGVARMLARASKQMLHGLDRHLQEAIS